MLLGHFQFDAPEVDETCTHSKVMAVLHPPICKGFRCSTAGVCHAAQDIHNDMRNKIALLGDPEYVVSRVV